MKPKQQLPAVKPPRRIYQPKYPSFADPNPLLHPETIPYPFTARFSHWASVGGLAGMLLLGGGEVSAQETTDSLYNPFPLEKSGVPYRPVMYGTGLPQRMSTADAITTIRKAFASSGIKLDENVWLEEEDIGAHLNGYSKKDKIGFLLLEYGRMDDSFRMEYGEEDKPAPGELPRPLLADRVAAYRAGLEKRFLEFCENKEQYLNRHTRPDSDGLAGRYAAQLAALEPQESLLDTFINYRSAYTIDLAKEQRTNKEIPAQFLAAIEAHTTDPTLKAILLNLTNRVVRNNDSAPYTGHLLRALTDLDSLESEEEFGQGLLNLMTFHRYNSTNYVMRRDEEYLKLKLAIMKHQPTASWINHLDKLASYSDRRTISLPEAERVDERNKSGDLHVAPISMLGNLTIVPDVPYISPELRAERKRLSEDLQKAKGITSEVLAAKKEDKDLVREKYSYERLSKLSKEEQQEQRKLRQKEYEAIRAKYLAMETITDDEREAFKQRLTELNDRILAERQRAEQANKQDALRNLEKQVKMYIRWAKSQQGY